MSPVCTCGATLPEDARFCHRCGKPQREEDRAFAGKFEPAQKASPPPLPVSASPGNISFSNPLAIRTSFFVASVTMVLLLVPVVNAITPLLGGYFSASLYQRRSGRQMTAGAGAKLGWITSVIYILFVTVLMTLNIALLGNALVEQLRDIVRNQANNPMQKEFLALLANPYGLAEVVFASWFLICAFSIASSIAGGALGARLYRPRSS